MCHGQKQCRSVGHQRWVCEQLVDRACMCGDIGPVVTHNTHEDNTPILLYVEITLQLMFAHIRICVEIILQCSHIIIRIVCGSIVPVLPYFRTTCCFSSDSHAVFHVPDLNLSLTHAAKEGGVKRRPTHIIDGFLNKIRPQV